MSRPLLANLDSVLRRVHAARRLLLAFDFDGTLSPIAARPEDAVLPRATASALAGLSAREEVTIAILSGRSLADLERRLGLACVYAGNHGLEIEGPGISFRHPDAVLRRPALFSACADLEAALDGIGGAIVERKGLSATVHFRQVAYALHDRVRSAVERSMRPYAACLDVWSARQAWEIRPRVAWDKGAALRFVLEHLGGSLPLVICAGDDVGDEPMFDAVPDAVSIRVRGENGTAARYSVGGPAEVTAFLERLIC